MFVRLFVLLVFGVGIGIAFGAPDAFASTVSVELAPPAPPGDLAYVADAGEMNDVTVSLEGDTFRVVDPGATIVVGSGCLSVSDHEATCLYSGPATFVGVLLGDLDDSATVTGDLAAANITLVGGAGNDTLRAGPGGAMLHGGDGDDLLLGGPGSDFLQGGDGDDRLDGGLGRDDLDGGAGIDTVDYSARTNPVTACLGFCNVPSSGEEGEDDSIRDDVENLIGGSGDDILLGSHRDGTINGGPGDDLLDGNAGADRLIGGEGFDTVSYQVTPGSGGPVGVVADLDGESEDDGRPGEADTIVGDVEALIGTDADDVLIGNDEDNLLIGDWGND